VHAQRLADDLAHGHARIQRRVRILEDDLQLAAHLAHARRVNCVMSWPLKMILPSGRLEQLDHGAAEGRLAAAGLADEPERLAGAQR
jgi:hypothetical protein